MIDISKLPTSSVPAAADRTQIIVVYEVPAHPI